MPPAARAARLYLDVAFFHPFEDGNARAALLALHFELLRSGVRLDFVAPVARTVRRADDAEGAADLARLVQALLDAARRRAVGSGGEGSTGVAGAGVLRPGR